MKLLNPRDPVRIVGMILLLLGVCLNPFVLVFLFSPDGVIMPVKKMVIFAFDVLCAGMGLWLIGGRIRPRRLSRLAGLLALYAVLIFACLEGGLRLFFALRNKVIHQGKTLDHALGWRTNPQVSREGLVPGYGQVRYSTTNFGFRMWGSLSNSHPRMLVVGDSSTEAVQVSDGEAYYEVLKRRFPELEVFAYGTGGYGSLQEYLIVDQFIDVIRPNIILWQFDGNDLINNCWEMECESEDNNHMFRPYLENGRIQLRYPSNTSNKFLRALEASYVVKMINVLPLLARRGHQGSLGIQVLREDHSFFSKACSNTHEIMALLKRRTGPVPVVGFCIHEGSGRVAGKAYEQICSELGFHYLRGFDELCMAEQSRGVILTGMENGTMVDTHLNARGHSLLGNWLSDSLVEQTWFSNSIASSQSTHDPAESH